MTYDIVVVGAGPAGGYAAYLLAKEGLKVAVIDKETFPRDKVCGGGISNKTVELLDFDVRAIAQKNIVGAYLTYQNRHTVVKDLDGRSGVTVLRSEFDNYILDRARKAGAVFRERCSFEGIEQGHDLLGVATSAGRIEARYVLGADGVYSQVRHKWFGKSVVTYAPALEAIVRVTPDVIDRFANRTLLDFGGMQRGYGWIFPKREHLNVGVFSIYGSRGIRDALHRFMRRYRSLADATDVTYKGHSIPLRNAAHLYEKRNVLLLGDAAGFAESFYGEGIYFALASAIIAARAVMRSFGKEGGVYTSMLKSELLSDMLYSRLNARMFFPIQKFGYYKMVRNKHVNYYFAELIAGRVSYRECFYKSILTSPYWLMSEHFPYVEDPGL